MLVRWNLIVCSLTQSSPLIAAVVLPAATAERIVCSRSVSPGSAWPGAERSRRWTRGGVEHDAAGDLADDRQQVGGLNALDDVGVGAGVERRVDRGAVLGGRQDDGLDRPASRGGSPPRTRRRRRRACAGRAARRPGAGARSAPAPAGPVQASPIDLDVVAALERAPDARENQRMIVGDQHAGPARDRRLLKFEACCDGAHPHPPRQLGLRASPDALLMVDSQNRERFRHRRTYS